MKIQLVLLSLCVGWCGLPARAADGSARMKATLVDPAHGPAADVCKIGEAAIGRLGYAMMNELAVAQSKGGLEAAVDVCHLKGTIDLPGITGVKLTSLKLRNQANTPDAAEKQVLDYVETQMTNGEDLPRVLVQRVETENRTEWRVYRPLGLAPRCVACHGDPAGQPAALRAKLEKLYPTDQAGGYQTGEWRGLIRVIVAPPATT